MRIEFKQTDMTPEFEAFLRRVHRKFEDKDEFVNYVKRYLYEAPDIALRDMRTAFMMYADLTLLGGIETEFEGHDKPN